MSRPLSPNALRMLTTLVVLVGVTLLALLAEGSIRMLQWLRHGTAGTVESLYATDPALNLRIPRPGASTPTIQINSMGFRGPEIEQEKPAGRIRIAFLGASTTFCAEASGNAAVWPHLVTLGLQQRYPERSFDYVNAGVPGYTLRSILAGLRLRVAPLRPDVIVIYEATNDMSAELRELARAQGLYAQARVENPSALAQYSVLWSLVEKNWQIRRSQSEARTRQGRLEFDPVRIGGAFRRDLLELVGEAQRAAPLVVVATFTYQLRSDQTSERQLDAAASALYYMPFMSPAGLIRGYERYNEIIRDVARETGALLVADELAIPGDPVHFADSVHLTDAGNRAMAERVVRVLASGGLDRLGLPAR